MNWFWDNILLKKEDRIGIIAFSCILFLILIGKWYLVVHYHPNLESDTTTIKESIEYTYLSKEVSPPAFSQSAQKNLVQELELKSKKMESSTSIVENIPPLSLFYFDPNSVSKDSLIELGINEYAVKNIIKYRDRGGRFFESTDLKKIYGIDTQYLKQLIPFIKIKSVNRSETAKSEVASSTYKPKETIALSSIPINRSDTTDFMKIKGIGPVYANRIVKYRNLLGGYFSIDQLNEVWGISDSLFHQVKPYLVEDHSNLDKRNINELAMNELAKHPYIDWKQAKIITKYIKMHGSFGSMDELHKIHGIDPKLIDTLTYYFEAK